MKLRVPAAIPYFLALVALAYLLYAGLSPLFPRDFKASSS
jgi:hypothetical protein